MRLTSLRKTGATSILETTASEESNPPDVDPHRAWRMAQAQSPATRAVRLCEAMKGFGPPSSRIANGMSQWHAKRTSYWKWVVVVWPRQAGSGGEQPVDLGPRTRSR
jgi:hypothetical protein